MTKKHLIMGVVTLCLVSLLMAPVALAGDCACDYDDADCTVDPCPVGKPYCNGGDGVTADSGTCATQRRVEFPGSAYVNAEMDIMDTAETVIDAIMAFLGLIAVVIILIGGFQWMTAAGNEDKVKTAKKTLSAGIVGIVIVLAAWGIARFVISLIAKV